MSEFPDYIIRPIEDEEIYFLKEALYLSIFVPPSEPPVSQSIVDAPELVKYYDHWGRKGDFALVVSAKNSTRLIGAAWYRCYDPENPGYGFVGKGIPELSIALLPDFRNKGLGTEMIGRLQRKAREANLKGISLSVDRRNKAMALYYRLGFKVVENTGNPIMLYTINNE